MYNFPMWQRIAAVTELEGSGLHDSSVEGRLGEPAVGQVKLGFAAAPGT